MTNETQIYFDLDLNLAVRDVTLSNYFLDLHGKFSKLGQVVSVPDESYPASARGFPPLLQIRELDQRAGDRRDQDGASEQGLKKTLSSFPVRPGPSVADKPVGDIDHARPHSSAASIMALMLATGEPGGMLLPSWTMSPPSGASLSRTRRGRRPDLVRRPGVDEHRD